MHPNHIIVFDVPDDGRAVVERVPVLPPERALAAPANDVDEYADTEPVFVGTGPGRGEFEARTGR